MKIEFRGKGTIAKKWDWCIIESDSYQWFIYDSDDKLIGYGDPDNWDELVGFGTYLTLHCKGKHGYHNFKSLKAVRRFIRNCEAIKKGQSIVIRVSRYIGYKDIRITK